nr:ChaC-like family protein [Tanacetum cinerariifolium]
MVAISKEEEVQKISTSIFVTNFPNHAKAKDLWNFCKQYGQVVDAFIPDRKSKAGKRYGFVRFIRVYDVDRLVSNLYIKGIPLKLWSESTFNKIATKWGKMLYLEKLDEGCLYSKRLCILTTGKSNILETFKIIHKGKRFLVRAKETMGWIPDFDEQEEDNSESEDEQSIGFIKENFDGSDVEKEGDNNVSMVPESVNEDVNVQAKEKGENG